MKRSAIAGVLLCLLGIACGIYLDGGKVSQMLQPTAALIVFGGTFGAVVIQFPIAVILDALAQLKGVFIGSNDQTADLIAQLIRYTDVARRRGLLALEAELDFVSDAFFRKALTLAIDGTHPDVLRSMMEIELDNCADRDELLPKVFEAAGGFAPTVGILGAVIGLIQVMQKLSDINEVGRGIAVAFVATIYGVGAANLFFLPCAGRIHIMLQRTNQQREMMLDGVLAIIAKVNPRELEVRLSAYNASQVPQRAPSRAVAQV